MSIVARQWVSAAAVVPQERGAEFLGVVDDASWSDGIGFYRGFFSAFRILSGKAVWFHFPLPTTVEKGGASLYLKGVSLLWECIDDARIDWIVATHGGMERLELTPRMHDFAAIAVPFEPEPQFRKWIPDSNRQLSEFDLPTSLLLRFGVQLSVLVSAPERDGTVRFYGAGAALSDLP